MGIVTEPADGKTVAGGSAHFLEQRGALLARHQQHWHLEPTDVRTRDSLYITELTDNSPGIVAANPTLCFG